MEFMPFVPLGLVFTVPLILLTLLLIANRKTARPYLLFVLLGSLLGGMSGLGAGPARDQISGFTTFFVLSWIVLGLVAFIAWLVVSALTGTDRDNEETPQ